MKKAPLTAKHQARRTRALERFSLRARGSNESVEAYDAYCRRKHEERDALFSRLGR